jgi:hypothetical protein
MNSVKVDILGKDARVQNVRCDVCHQDKLGIEMYPTVLRSHSIAICEDCLEQLINKIHIGKLVLEGKAME